MANVFAAPTEVFEEVRDAPPSVANWLFPIVAMIGASCLSLFILFSDPAILANMRQQQERAIQKRVDEGKIPPEAAENARNAMNRFGTKFAVIAGSAGAIVTSFAIPFWWAFVLWGIARTALRSRVRFMKCAETAGLATMIYVLGAFVTLLVSLFMGRMTSGVSLALFVDELDPESLAHQALGAVNVFYIWFVAVLGIGLGTLARAPAGKALAWIFGVWIVLRLALIGGAIVLQSAF